jgi:hypothetical protein
MSLVVIISCPVVVTCTNAAFIFNHRTYRHYSHQAPPLLRQLALHHHEQEGFASAKGAVARG